MRRITSGAATVAVLTLMSAALTACSDNPVATDPSLSGNWAGQTTVQGSVFSVNLQVTENNGNVNANGTLTFINPVAVSATGTYNFPSVSMTIRSTGFEDLNFNGTLSADGASLTGSMQGSGFDNFSITLRRQ